MSLTVPIGRLSFKRIASVALWSLAVALLVDALLNAKWVKRATATDAQPAAGSFTRTQGTATKPIPYTVILAETTYSPVGAARPAGKYTFAVRSDDSFVRRMESTNGPQVTAQREIHLANGTFIDVHEFKELRNTFYKWSNPKDALRDPQSKCVNSRSGLPFRTTERAIGEEMIGGYHTVKLQDGHLTHWVAVDLGCAELKMRVDNATDFTEQNVYSIIPGEPREELFKVTNGFREVTPSELYGLKMPIRDRTYYSHQTQ
jgi:hypothetical protein